jgi:hypothetical protein
MNDISNKSNAGENNSNNSKSLINVSEFGRVIFEIAFGPGDFYERAFKKPDFGSALLFLMIVSLIYTIGVSIFIPQYPLIKKAMFFLNPFIMPFILAFTFLVVSKLFWRKLFTYEILFIVMAYAHVVHILSWIPGMEWITGIWKYCLIGIGLMKCGNIRLISAAALIFISLFFLYGIMRLLSIA